MARPATGQVLERDGVKGRTYALRFRAYGQRQYVTLGTDAEGWTRKTAEAELANVLADVRRGIWKAPAPAPVLTAPEEELTLHAFASEWVERHRLDGVEERTIDYWTWALSHVLEHLAALPLAAITVERVDLYKAEKVREREALTIELAAWHEAKPGRRGARPPRALGNESINRTLMVLERVLDDAVRYKRIPQNPVRDVERLKVKKPRRIWLDYVEVRSLLDAAGRHRALVATMILTGLRVSELCALRWRSVDTAAGKLTVENSKTEAGEWRTIDLTPLLLEELKLHRAANTRAGRDDLVFPTMTGGQRDRHNVRARILLPALLRANAKRAVVGLAPIAHVTNHTLRRTFASVLYDAGASPADVMAQMGHKSAALALEVYARKMNRSSETPKRMDDLLDWARMGTNDAERVDLLPVEKTEGSAIPLR